MPVAAAFSFGAQATGEEIARYLTILLCDLLMIYVGKTDVCVCGNKGSDTSAHHRCFMDVLSKSRQSMARTEIVMNMAMLKKNHP